MRIALYVLANRICPFVFTLLSPPWPALVRYAEHQTVADDGLAYIALCSVVFLMPLTCVFSCSKTSSKTSYIPYIIHAAPIAHPLL